MKLFIKLRNKYFTILASLALLVLSSIGLFNICTPSSVDATMIKFDNEKTITITNGSFTNFSSSSSYPYTLSSFSTSGNKTPNMKTGAINISDSDYAKNYKSYGLGEYENPKGVGNDNYVLMINADKDSNYTYTSSEFTLSANGYYYITVSAKTIGDNSVASVFLTKDGAVYENCLIENITSTTWSNYTFFVATNSYESVKLKVGMQIGNLNGGASGCVLFDELHAGQISVETMTDSIKSLDDNSYRFVDNRTQNAYKEYKFDNKIVEYTRDEKGEIVYDNDNQAVVNIDSENYFNQVTSGTGLKTIDISNNVLAVTTNDTYINYKGQEEILDANSTYKFSIMVNATSISKGSVFIGLDEIIDDSEDYDDFMDSESTEISAKSASLTISSATSNTVTGGYTEYSIYVRTGALTTSKVQFSFGIGDSNEGATGNVSFKNYMIERVPYSAYSSASTGSTVDKMDISDRLTLSSSEYSNYTFDKMESNSFDGIAYPATPSNWTQSNDKIGYQLSGVVNLSEFDKVMNKYSSNINKVSTPSALNNSLNNNVLMIYNGTKSTHSYTSSSKTLSANKYYKITVFVNTHMWDSDASGVTILAKTGSNVLAQANNIKTAGAWKRVEFYVNTPSNSVDLSLELALGYGQNTSSGYAFFDNILVEEADTANDFSNRFAEYPVVTMLKDGKEVKNGEVKLDLTNTMLASTEGREYNTSVLYNGTNKGETVINAGIVDLTSDLKMIRESYRETLRDIPGNSSKVLAIVSATEQDGRYEYASVLNYSFESGKYYKLSFNLFTDDIAQEEKENMYDNGKLAQGVNVELTNLENAKFNYIQSNGKWTSFEFYIGVNSTATSNLVFSMGSDFTGCYGKAFLGDINLETIEQTDFDVASNGETLLKIDTVESDEEDNNQTSTETNGNNFSWVYIPTIATFLAIVVAVVGVFIRRNVKFKKGVKTTKAEYDRDITVMQNKYRRLAQDQRAKEVRELTKERDELVALRVEYEDKYKDALSRLRSARLANRDGSKRHEIMAIEHEVKHISKEVARFGVQVNNYDNEIEFMQTEAYLVDLEKRMMREDNNSRNQFRKELEMSEEERIQAVAKREEKQKQAELKAQAKAEKLASKQAKLQQQREEVQIELQQAKELDEKYVKEQELKQIRLQEEKLAKEKAKAERELQKIEKQRLSQQNVVEESENLVDSTENQSSITELEPNEQSSENSNNADLEVENLKTENVEVDNSTTNTEVGQDTTDSENN